MADETGQASRDPYAVLDAHVISVKALYCEDGCGVVGTSGYGDDRDAARELAQRGWVVRPHSMGGLTALCKECAERHDIEAEEDDLCAVCGDDDPAECDRHGLCCDNCHDADPPPACRCGRLLPCRIHLPPGQGNGGEGS